MDKLYGHDTISQIINTYVEYQSREGTLYSAEPPQDVLTDFLTDLRHYCRASGLDFDQAVGQSAMLHHAEA